MSLEPLLLAPWHIQVHTFAAIAAFALGAIQFLAPKGTLPHRLIGPAWVILMAAVILSAVFIVRPRDPGEPFLAHFSFIHYIFIPLTTILLLQGVWRVARGGPNMKRHGSAFFGIFLGGIIITGAFTFMPGRIMHAVVTGGSTDNTYEYPNPYLYFLPGAEEPEDSIARRKAPRP